MCVTGCKIKIMQPELPVVLGSRISFHISYLNHRKITFFMLKGKGL